MGLFSKVLRAGEAKKVRNLQAVVPLINSLESETQLLSDESLVAKTNEFRERLDNGEDLNDLLVESFAVVREASFRVIGQRHFDVQLLGGMVLHFGGIAEMKTGEGKTLVSTCPVYLNALTGRGVHLITVNDYLASFHAGWMGQIYKFMGLSVGLVVPDVSDPVAKRKAYAADLTYGTNNEMGFDYLRDNMAFTREQMVQRDHVYAIVDEVDSILIDEARTPLIIAGPSNDSNKLYYQFASIVRALKRDVDYEVDEEKRTVVPTEAGIARVEKMLAVDNLYDGVATNMVHQMEKALQAKELYKRDDDYMVADGEVQIIDEHTGRVLEGRRWNDGLHQAVEAKERVRIQEENHTWATVTLQNYFRMYEKLSGMTGTAETEAAEFASTYGLHVTPIPTNRPMVRADKPDLIYKSEDTKFNAVVEEILDRNDKGQPVLVGTASVERSEHLSKLLEKRGIPHNVLNAKQHTREAAVIAQAGRLHSVTVATNMAGRGVDILLGGYPEGLAMDDVKALGLNPDSEEGEAKYQELLEKYLKQCRAEGDEVRELGGLYVLGSERHDSRRIDNQLRGRSGRQGDPGESRFYLSLEDELMRLFATGAVSWVMNKALPDDIPIETKMVSKSIEKAQNTVEQKNAEIRKDVLKYDEVYDAQRKEIYNRRMQIIDGEDLQEYTEQLLSDIIAKCVHECCPNDFEEDWDLPLLVAEITKYYPTKFTAEDLEAGASIAHITESLVTEAIQYYDARHEQFGAERAGEIERSIMLQIIDQRWRLHLLELDHLQDGIHLRGLAQTDPLFAWKKESFEMFGKLSEGIADDYLQYVMHVQLVEEPAPSPEAGEAVLSGPDDSVTEWPAVDQDEAEGEDSGDDQGRAQQEAGAAKATAAVAGSGAGGPKGPGRAPGVPASSASNAAKTTGASRPGAGKQAAGKGGRATASKRVAQPARPGQAQGPQGGAAGGIAGRSRQDMQANGAASGRGPRPASDSDGDADVQGVSASAPKLGRNEPCYCGSGRKFKLCHGAN